MEEKCKSNLTTKMYQFEKMFTTNSSKTSQEDLVGKF